MKCPIKCKLSEIKKYTVIDNIGQNIGEPIDFGLNTKMMTAEVMVIGGGVIEELLEALELREDIDEYVFLDQIKEVTESEIHLFISEADLQKTNNKGELSSNLIRFQQLLRKKVINSDEELIGEIRDMYLNDSNTFFILINSDFNAMMRSSYKYNQTFQFIIKSSMLTEGSVMHITLDEITSYVLSNYNRQAIGLAEVPIYKIMDN